jgi:cyclopropane-fatty-acyl-phospholipid synthase
MGETRMIAEARRWFQVIDQQSAPQIVGEALARAGITVGGDAPWDIKVNDPRLYRRVLSDGTLGVGESYVEGWWDCQALDQLIDRVYRGGVERALGRSWILAAHLVRARLFNRQAARPFEVGERHYDVGNDLYRAMLGRRMVYTCAYWKDADTLDAAQDAKLDLVCRKLGLRPGMRVLDLGCGWAGFAAFAAEHYGAHVVGYTVSREQVAWAKEHYAGLPIDIRLDDYRNAAGRFDAVVSIGLMEHVGPKNHRAYMEQAVRCLAPGGLVFIHTIGGANARTQIDPWFERYIFPNAAIPSLGQLGTAMQGILVPEDVQNIGPHYDRTLMAWWANFEAAWPELRERYGDRFYRAWKYYLLVSAGGFRARQLNLYQIVATPVGAPQPPTARSS